MIGYVRPAVVIAEFRDDDGTVIPYGSRWAEADHDGPDDTYSETRHPERFAPLVEVARSLIDQLEKAYDVRRTDEGDEVELRPADPTAAPLRFTFTDFPGVSVRAGLATLIAFACGCDHCDEDVLDLIANLEQEVGAVVGGRFEEWLNEGPVPDTEVSDLEAPSIAYRLRRADGVSLSGGQVLEESQLEILRRAFANVPDRWSAWETRRA